MRGRGVSPSLVCGTQAQAEADGGNFGIDVGTHRTGNADMTLWTPYTK